MTARRRQPPPRVVKPRGPVGSGYPVRHMGHMHGESPPLGWTWSLVVVYFACRAHGWEWVGATRADGSSCAPLSTFLGGEP